MYPHIFVENIETGEYDSSNYKNIENNVEYVTSDRRFQELDSHVNILTATDIFLIVYLLLFF